MDENYEISMKLGCNRSNIVSGVDANQSGKMPAKYQCGITTLPFNQITAINANQDPCLQACLQA